MSAVYNGLCSPLFLVNNNNTVSNIDNFSYHSGQRLLAKVVNMVGCDLSAKEGGSTL